MRRLPVFIGSEDLNDNRLKVGVNSSVDLLPGATDLAEKGKTKGLISFGGWSENVPLSTLAMLPSCSQATFFVSSGKPGLGNSFQEDAIRAALRGWNFFVKVWDKISGALGRPAPRVGVSCSETLCCSQRECDVFQVTRESKGLL